MQCFIPVSYFSEGIHYLSGIYPKAIGKPTKKSCFLQGHNSSYLQFFGSVRQNVVLVGNVKDVPT